MSNLQARLERLERDMTATSQRIVWIEPGEDQATALARAGGLRRGEVPVFVKWKTAEGLVL